jgi:hypothetical protein
MLWKATAAGVVYVIAPTKYAKKVSPIPLALIVVGKISAAQTKDGASTHWYAIIYRKMKTRQAALPGLFVVPTYFHWRRASAIRMAAMSG